MKRWESKVTDNTMDNFYSKYNDLFAHNQNRRKEESIYANEAEEQGGLGLLHSFSFAGGLLLCDCFKIWKKTQHPSDYIHPLQNTRHLHLSAKKAFR